MFATGKELYRGLGHHPSAIWDEMDETYLTSKLYTKLLYKTFEDLPRINADYISFSMPCNGLEYLGRVQSVIGRRVFYDLVDPSSIESIGEGSVDYVDILNTDRRKINGNKPKIKVSNVLIKEPRFIVLTKDDIAYSSGVKFSRNDFQLEKYLRKTDVGTIKSVEDLEQLARNVCHVRPYEKNDELVELRPQTPLGEFMDMMAVCVEFSGLMYALLTLHDIDADLLLSRNHAFVGAKLHGKDYIINVTPEKIFVVAEENYLDEIAKLKIDASSYREFDQACLIQDIIS